MAPDSLSDSNSACTAKRQSSLSAPIERFTSLSGIVTEINSELNDTPDLINSEPYSEGWIFILKANDDSELNELIDANSYYELINED